MCPVNVGLITGELLWVYFNLFRGRFANNMDILMALPYYPHFLYYHSSLWILNMDDLKRVVGLPFMKILDKI